MWISVCIYVIYNTSFLIAVHIFFQHFSWEFLMIGILHAKHANTIDVSLPAISMKYFYFCLLASVYAIHQ